MCFLIGNYYACKSKRPRNSLFVHRQDCRIELKNRTTELPSPAKIYIQYWYRWFAYLNKNETLSFPTSWRRDSNSSGSLHSKVIGRLISALWTWCGKIVFFREFWRQLYQGEEASGDAACKRHVRVLHLWWHQRIWLMLPSSAEVDKEEKVLGIFQCNKAFWIKTPVVKEEGWWVWWCDVADATLLIDLDALLAHQCDDGSSPFPLCCYETCNLIEAS